IESLINLRQGDLNDALPFANETFDAAMSLDVIPHLVNRGATFREVNRILTRGARFLFTDAAVLTGAASSHQLRLRASSEDMQFAAPGFNERCLEQAGFRILETEDRTGSVVRNAAGRLAARHAHREELQRSEGAEAFEWQRQYLETVVALADAR